MDWEALGKELGEQAFDAFKGYARGAAEDLKAWGLEIGKDLVRYIKDDRPAMEKEVRGQLKLLAEMKRIDLEGVGLDFLVDQVLRFAKVARVALLAGGLIL